MANTVIASTQRPGHVTPYQLDKSQVLKASTALLIHAKTQRRQREVASEKKNLLDVGLDNSEEEDVAEVAEPVWLILTTKKHVRHEKSLKPTKIAIPHTLNTDSTSKICIFTPDPQRTFKDVVQGPSFPEELASKIRVMGLKKLRSRYKSFESRRQLHAQYDVFLADERIVPMLPKLLGKIYFDSSKRPLPVRLEGYKGTGKDLIRSTMKRDRQAKQSEPKSVAKPEQFAKEVERALSSAHVHLAPSTTTATKVGFSNFMPEQIADNVGAVVTGMVGRVIPEGWRNVKAVHIKTPNSASLPIWLTDEMWVEDDDVLDQDDAEEAKSLVRQKGRKRKERALEEGKEGEPKKALRIEAGGKDTGLSKEKLARREQLRKQKQEARTLLSAVSVVS